MKKPIFFAFVLIAIVLTMIGLASEYFWHSTFIESLVATLAGVVLGVPFALWINRQNLAEEEKVKRADEKQEAAIRRAQVLERVGSELQYNLQALEEQERAVHSAGSRRGLEPPTSIRYRLKAELWNSLRYSGDLQWINDPNLLDRIGTAYYQIGTIALVEESFLSEVFSGAAEDAVRDIIPKALNDVKQALADIDKVP